MRAILPPSDARSAWSHVAASTAGVRRPLVLAVLLLAGAAGSGILIPLAFGRLVDVIAAEGSVSDLLGPSALAGSGVAGAAVFGVGAAVLLGQVLETVLSRLRQQVIDSALSLPSRLADEIPDGELASRATDDVDALREASATAVPVVASSVFAVVATLAGLAAVHPLFAVALLAVVPVHVVSLRMYLRRAPRLYARERAAIAARSRAVLFAVRARREIQALGSAQTVRRRFAARSSAVVKFAIASRRVQSTFGFRVNMAELVGMTALLVTAGVLATTTGVSAGDATSAVLLFLALFGPIGAILFLVDDLQSAGAALTRIVGVIEAVPRGHEPAPLASRVDPVAGAAVDARNMSFVAPNGTRILEGIDLTVARGEWVAIVGVSGAGKTTLARVVAGILPPSSGAVTIGGTAPSELSEEERAALVTMVGQQAYVFSTDLAANLRLARSDATDVELELALTAVVGDHWSREFPDGLATLLGDDGLPVDSTVAHWVALTRAAVSRAPVVILDEATADAGSREARDLDDAAHRALAGRSVVVIAHRLSQAARADRIVVLDAGGVVEVGPPDTLLRAGGLYSSMWRAWSAERPYPAASR